MKNNYYKYNYKYKMVKEKLDFRFSDLLVILVDSLDDEKLLQYHKKLKALHDEIVEDLKDYYERNSQDDD